MTDVPVGAQAQVARLLTLVPFLHHHPEVRLADAATLLDSSPGQVLDDLKVLFLCGLPGGYPDDLIDVDLDAIETEAGEIRAEGVVRVSNADYLARPLRLTPIEASALVVSLRLLRESAPLATVGIVDRVIAKLEAAARDLDRQQVGRQIDVTPGEERRSELAALALTLEEAVRARRQVRLEYFVPSRDQVSERVVDPIGVVTEGRRSYLDAWCHTAEGPRLFRLDRINRAEVLESAVTTEPREPRDLTLGALLGDEETVRVTIRLAPEATWMTGYYDIAAERPMPDGGLEVDLEVADPRWLVRLLLRLAPYATLVGAEEFTHSFEGAAQQTLSLYQDGVD